MHVRICGIRCLSFKYIILMENLTLQICISGTFWESLKSSHLSMLIRGLQVHDQTVECQNAEWTHVLGIWLHEVT
jgi:hypothetical protein